MFWRKKKATNAGLILSDGTTPTDRRNAYRYVFPQTRRLSTTFKGKSVQLLNISARGTAFVNEGFQPDDADKICLNLEMPNFNGNPMLCTWARILHITTNNVCHCSFEDCRVEDYELIHKYVLEMQKQERHVRFNSGV